MLVSLFLLVATAATDAVAIPVTADADIQVRDGDLAAARRAALDAALVQAVNVVLDRHVAAVDRRGAARDAVAAILSRSSRYILRYGISSEDLTADLARVEVEAEVDRDRVLAELRRRGVTVHVLDVRPRVLLVPVGGAQTTPTAQTLRELFEAEGYRTRVYPGDMAESVDEAQASEWARDLGCHVAAIVAVEAETTAAEGAAASSGEAPAAREAMLPAVRVQGWLVDALAGGVLGRSEAETVPAPEPTGDGVGARARAARRAGRVLAYALLADLEQSGWHPEGRPARLELEIAELPGVAEVEYVQRELVATAEFRRVELRQIGYRSAVWQVDALSGGLGWDAILGTARLPGGRLAYTGGEALGGEDGGEVVRARWVAP